MFEGDEKFNGFFTYCEFNLQYVISTSDMRQKESKYYKETFPIKAWPRFVLQDRLL